MYDVLLTIVPPQGPLLYTGRSFKRMPCVSLLRLQQRSGYKEPYSLTKVSEVTAYIYNTVNLREAGREEGGGGGGRCP